MMYLTEQVFIKFVGTANIKFKLQLLHGALQQISDVAETSSSHLNDGWAIALRTAITLGLRNA
jgi:hypothetical protein